MNVLFISQCHKKALKETRRLLDQFAERVGDRVWKTSITEAGLETVRKLLKQSARRNTAVACHRLGAHKMGLCWIIGNRQQFNDEGVVPTNYTKRSILPGDQENDWQPGKSIQIVSTLAALLHDIGKGTVGFQKKLKRNLRMRDPYRHEWISLQLFLIMIKDCNSNEAVLMRLRDFEQYQQSDPQWFNQLSQIEHKDRAKNLEQLPAIARWLSWLIVSHHRMPWSSVDCRRFKYQPSVINSGKIYSQWVEDFSDRDFFFRLEALAGWIKADKGDEDKPFWRLVNNQKPVTFDMSWLKSLKRWARKALEHPPLMTLLNTENITDRFLLHFSRLSLMLGDHHFSAQSSGSAMGKKEDGLLIANTDHEGQPKQQLAEHLLGVADCTAQFARCLPALRPTLPALINHKPFSKRTPESRFRWQDKAYDLAASIQSTVEEAGFFGVNMASTGCGKTVANSRIMYALADPKQGLRVTIALGLRVLTLQTGEALSKKLELSEEQLAVLVGSRSIRELYEAQQSDSKKTELDETELDEESSLPHGSESAEPLLSDSELLQSDWMDFDDDVHRRLLGVVIADDKAKKLLFSPIVSCTIDHLTQINECARGGKYIIPTLRLLTSDLILDEPDDFDYDDLPALTRLVHSAGLLGSKVLLSSATLTPHLVAGLFEAYQAGRNIWQQHKNNKESAVVCAWFDEFKQVHQSVATKADFMIQHARFIKQRVTKLAKEKARRSATILPIGDCIDSRGTKKIDFTQLAQRIYEQMYTLHRCYHDCDASTGKRASIGLIRFSHTKNIIQLAHHLYKNSDKMAKQVQLHVVVYHARQLLLLRSSLEQKLDRLLNRKDTPHLFSHKEIQEAIDNDSSSDHIFVVIGTPITEVGRDHDYDWAIIEPSSMRSIIQLAGRVWRHRPEKELTAPNMAILSTNLRALDEEGGGCFCHPGFETEKFRLQSHQMDELMSTAQLDHITAIPRIVDLLDEFTPATMAVPYPIATLALLEQVVIADLFNTLSLPDSSRRKSNEVTSFWQQGLAHPYTMQLQLLTPFRFNPKREQEYVCQYQPDEEGDFNFYSAQNAWKLIKNNDIDAANYTDNALFHYDSRWDWDDCRTVQVKYWLTSKSASDLASELKQLKKTLKSRDSEQKLAVQFSTVTLDVPYSRRWAYHFSVGFYRDDLKF